MHKYKTHVKTKKGQKTAKEPEKIIRDLLHHIFSSTNKKNYELSTGARNEQEGYPFPFVNKYLWWNYYNNNTNLSRDKYVGSLTLNYDITPWLNLMGRAGRDFNLDQYTSTNRPVDVIGLQDL